MTDLKTISQIAEDIGVTRQAVYSKLKYAELSNALTPYIVKRGKRTLYNLEAQNLIKQAFSASNVNSMSSECQDNVNELTKQLNEQLTILSKCKVELDKALRDNEAQTAELSQKELVVKQLTNVFLKRNRVINHSQIVRMRAKEAEILNLLFNGPASPQPCYGR